MAQTALQELIEKLKSEKEKRFEDFINDKGMGFKRNHLGGMVEALSFIIDEAQSLLPKERQIIVDAWTAGLQDWLKSPHDHKYNDGEDYFQQTLK